MTVRHIPRKSKVKIEVFNNIGIADIVVAIVGATPLPKLLHKKLSDGKARAVVATLEPVVCVALLLLCTAYLVDGSYNPFLYFRF